MHYRGILSTPRLSYQTPPLQKKIEVEDKGGNHSLFEHLMHSFPLQITLGVLFIIVQVSSLLGYLGKFDYFVLPQEFSHIFCAHKLFLPA
jgi:hypothetical protein